MEVRQPRQTSKNAATSVPNDYTLEEVQNLVEDTAHSRGYYSIDFYDTQDGFSAEIDGFTITYDDNNGSIESKTDNSKAAGFVSSIVSKLDD